MGAGGVKRPGAGMPVAQNPMQRPPTIMGGAVTPRTTFSGQMPQGVAPQAAAANPEDFSRYMQGMRVQEGAMPGSTMLSQPQGGKGGMPGAQQGGGMPPWAQGMNLSNGNPSQFINNFAEPLLGFIPTAQGGPMQQMPFPQMGTQGGPMRQIPQGGMLGAGPAPNAMQQFSQQQGLAGLMQPQQSSTNSLQ